MSVNKKKNQVKVDTDLISSETAIDAAAVTTRREQVILPQDKKEILAKFARKEGDTGSSEAQVALLTARIQNLTKHFSSHKKDKSSQRGMLELINHRKKLLTYLRDRDVTKYKSTIEALGLRK